VRRDDAVGDALDALVDVVVLVDDRPDAAARKEIAGAS
jgi:hypothetical protein